MIAKETLTKNRAILFEKNSKDESESIWAKYIVQAKIWEGYGKKRMYITVTNPNGVNSDFGYLDMNGDDDNLKRICTSNSVTDWILENWRKLA
jgi:hypothetical protein